MGLIIGFGLFFCPARNPIGARGRKQIRRDRRKSMDEQPAPIKLGAQPLL